MNPPVSQDVSGASPMRRRRLQAVFAADVVDFGGLIAIEETGTLDALRFLRQLAGEELALNRGWLFGLPGDGIFALFDSTVDAVHCALRIQSRLAESPKVYALKLRIGVHLGEVTFEDDLPFGETLVIASRLESLAEPGGVLVSAAVMDTVAPHIAATFSACGVPRLKHSARRIETFRVLASPPATSEPGPAAALLDRTIAPEPRAAGLDAARLHRLGLLLATHLGPMAQMLVRCKALQTADAAQLIAMLSREIPAEGERRKFLLQAQAEISAQR
jgi:class 3 adenylate cyclase